MPRTGFACVHDTPPRKNPASVTSADRLGRRAGVLRDASSPKPTLVAAIAHGQPHQLAEHREEVAARQELFAQRGGQQQRAMTRKHAPNHEPGAPAAARSQPPPMSATIGRPIAQRAEREARSPTQSRPRGVGVEPDVAPRALVDGGADRSPWPSSSAIAEIQRLIRYAAQRRSTRNARETIGPRIAGEHDVRRPASTPAKQHDSPGARIAPSSAKTKSRAFKRRDERLASR